MSENYIDNIHREPTQRGRTIDSAHETDSDAGGYSFVFYDPAQKRKRKKKDLSPGPAVDVKLSHVSDNTSAEPVQKTTQKQPNESAEHGDERTAGGHLNIKA